MVSAAAGVDDGDDDRGVCHGDVCEGGAGQEDVGQGLVERKVTYYHALVFVRNYV